MANPKILDEIGSKVSELLANSPAKDLEKNARALLASGFSKLDLVTREEFEVQREVLAHTREKLAALAPTAMLFIRCTGGISHNPAEDVIVGDVDKALQAMLTFIEGLAA